MVLIILMKIGCMLGKIIHVLNTIIANKACLMKIGWILLISFSFGDWFGKVGAVDSKYWIWYAFASELGTKGSYL